LQSSADPLCSSGSFIQRSWPSGDMHICLYTSVYLSKLAWP
jgi:hypothetical protein